jgi:primosomal protein N' (replication factor Y)
MRDLLIAAKDARGIADIGIIGPAPAYIHRLRGRYRWQLILRGSDLADFIAPIALPQGWTVNIDPVGLIQ